MASSSALSKTDTDEVPLRKPTKLRQLKERSISLVMSDLDIKEAWTQLNSEKQHSSSSCTTSPETGTRPQQSSADKPFRKSTGSDNTPTSYRSSKRKSCKTYSESPKRSSKKLRHSTNTSLSPTIAPSSPTQGAVWKKNANADEVRSALVKVMEMQESSSSRNFIPITPPLNIKRAKTEETKEDEPLTDRRVKKRAATSKIMKLSTRRLKTLSFNETNIVRGNRDESLPMMTHLEEEFKQFSKISFSRSDESLTPRTRSRLEEKPDKRTQIIIEIRASERSYVNQLTLVVDKYLTPAEALKANGGGPKFSVDEIFSNIKEIQIVHKSFLEQLDSKLEEWSASETIGDLFIQLIPELYIYNTYGKTYDASLLAIAQASKDSKFVHFLDRCHESTNTSLNLESLLIAPIQRIPRYILLLSDLQQQTPTDHPDYEAVGEAVKAFQQAAAEMNENIKKAKQRSTFEELTVSLKDLKAQDRLLIHECVIRCEKRRTNIAIFIFNDLFIHMSEGKAKSKSNLVFKRYHWPLNLMWIKDCKNEFTKIMGPDGFYKFRKCDTIAWESSLHKAITEHLALIKTPVKMDADSPLRYGTYTFLNNNATFTGIWKNGKVKKGTYSHLGTVYDGEFVMGKKGGVGKQNTFFQSCYIGKWENGRPNGKGVITDSAGNEYSGYFENGMKHGQGVIHYVTGEVYEGSWVKDYPEGVGTMIFPTGTTYAGNFENGRFHYYGVLKKEGSPTSYTYEGLWSHGIKEGTGRMISPGFTYDGEWKADLQEGIGKSIDHLGSYRGHWVAGVKEGQGTFTYISGTVYSGSWKRNLYHGTGKLTCKEGVFMSYEGEWHSGRKCGKGIMHFRNYDVYEGLFKDDIMHGAGVYTFAMGSIIEGKWNRGRLDGKVTFTRVKDNTKKVYTTTCKDNLLSLQDFPDSPIELNFQLPTLQCWHY